MPSKAYGKFQNNLETVQRLNESFDTLREARNKKGKGAFDHITRSAIVFLVSAFEVYCEDILCESVEKIITAAKDATNLPGTVKDTLNNYVKKEGNGVPPIQLCDEGWRKIYKDIAKIQAEYLNTPNTKNLKNLFKNYLGIDSSELDKVPEFDKLDAVIVFRGDIVHQIKATKYVHIEDVRAHLKTINEIVIGIDILIRENIKSTYNVKVPWNDTYVHIA